MVFADLDVVVYCFAGLALADVLFARHSSHRWFCIHAIANAVVAVTAVPGLLATLADPLHAMDGRVVPSPRMEHAPHERSATPLAPVPLPARSDRRSVESPC
jgi:hypothetical protein